MLNVVVIVKQVPRAEEMGLGVDGRLERGGVDLEMSPYCRRAVAKGVELVREYGGHCTVVTLGPPSAEDVLREALAWGADTGVLVSDPAFSGSDTLATARALAAAIVQSGPFDLVLAGRNSVDADTGQVPPELAEFLDLALLTGVRELRRTERGIWARCEHDDGWVEADVELPAMLSCAERLCAPCKAPVEARAAVDPQRIRHLTAADLGPGPWGEQASPTHVGDVHSVVVNRDRRLLDGPLEAQAQKLLDALDDRGVFDPGHVARAAERVPASPRGERELVVVCEPGRTGTHRELLGEAAVLANEVDGSVVAMVGSGIANLTELGTWGADEIVLVDGAADNAGIAAAIGEWCRTRSPWAVLGPGTMWGREVMGRLAARLGGGLTGDAVDLSANSGRLVASKPAFGGQLVAAITTNSTVQLATVRPGILSLRTPREGISAPRVESIVATNRAGVTRRGWGHDDELDTLARARVVIGVGTGVAPDDYPALEPLLATLGAELGATRKVTDKGWLPRARQIGITGRSIAPALYVALGASGKYNHMVGVRAAGTVVAVNPDPAAPVFEHCDLGIVAEWAPTVAALVDAWRSRKAPGAALATSAPESATAG